jgi:hypothetical protein
MFLQGIPPQHWRIMSYKAETPAPEVLRCATHDSTYSPGSSCYFCRTGLKPSDIGKDLLPKPSVVRRMARKNDPATSKEAARKVDPVKRRAIVEQVFKDAYPEDLANEQVAQILGVKDGSISSRVSELRDDFGVLRKTTRRHTSEDGGSQGCHVWVPLEDREEPTLPDPEEL